MLEVVYDIEVIIIFTFNVYSGINSSVWLDHLHAFQIDLLLINYLFKLYFFLNL